MLHEKVSGTRLESHTKCHGNVNEVPPTFDTFTECPLPQRTFLATRSIIAVFEIARITSDHNRVSNYYQTTLSLFTRSAIIRAIQADTKNCWYDTESSVYQIIFNEQAQSRLVLYHRDKFHQCRILPYWSSQKQIHQISRSRIYRTGHSFVANFRLSVSRERAFHRE